MALAPKIVCYFGVLEYWSIGVLEKAKALDSTWISPFITPLLHHSINPAYSCMSGKPLKLPLGWLSPQYWNSSFLFQHFTIFELVKVKENGSNSQDERTVENTYDSEKLNSTQDCEK